MAKSEKVKIIFGQMGIFLRSLDIPGLVLIFTGSSGSEPVSHGEPAIKASSTGLVDPKLRGLAKSLILKGISGQYKRG